MFETASFHIVKPCNMKCKFCYATFQDMKVIKQLPLDDAKNIVLKLKEAGLKKMTFAGGEPMLYKWIKEIIVYSHEIGLTTSIITNGAMLTNGWLKEMQPYLDWIGISIDSISNNTNKQIGRGISHLSILKKGILVYPTLMTFIHLRYLNFMTSTLKRRSAMNNMTPDEMAEQMGAPSKVHPNDPVFPSTEYGDTDISISTGIPIKLELASRFMAASITDTNHQFEGYDEIAKRCLRAADALINEFNNQQKEKK